MSIAQNIPFDSSYDSGLGHLPLPHISVTPEKRPLHRIADVRRRQGISVRRALRRMHTSIDHGRRQEEPGCDLLWENNAPLSEPVMMRARLLKIMKTVRAIKETATSSSIQRFATMLEQQLVELMPELKDVAAWHSIGQRRSPNELGRTAERVLP